ncbi:DUF551 domain-containing protein [Cronobacter muytjensii]
MNTISNERLEELRAMFSPSANKDVYLALGELLALRKERERTEPFVCPKCGNTGLADSGGVQPWGEPILIECDCTAPPAPTDKPKSEMSQKAEQLLRDTTDLAETLGAETDTTAQQLESLAGKVVGGSDGFECTPVADLYELLTKCGECYDYTTSAKVAADWIKEGYSAREYVKLDRLQEAMTHGSSGEPDGWIPCSERMPGIGEAVLMRISCSDHFNIESGRYKGDGLWLGCWFSTYGKKGSPYQVAHWMPIPAAPEPCK